MQKCLESLGSTEEDDIAFLLDSIPALESSFTVGRRIGHGTFSSVYLGQSKLPQLSGRKNYAIKHIIPTSHPSRIHMELKCLKLIGGINNVIEATCCFRNMNDVVLVMPYIPHDNFTEYAGKLTIKELGNYLYNLFLALKRVHSFNIIHRDIKPANFLYSRKYQRYALVDFGLAQEVNNSGTQLNGKQGNKDPFSPPLVETPQLNSSRKVKRKLTVSSPENSNLSAKKSRFSSSSFVVQSSTPGSVFSPASSRLNCSYLQYPRRSPRKLPSYILSKSPQKKEKSCGSAPSITHSNKNLDSPSKHTRFAEILQRSQTKPLKERNVSDSSTSARDNLNNFEGFVSVKDHSCGGMAASISIVSQIEAHSSNFSTRSGSTLQEVKTKSGLSILRPSSCSCYGSARVCAVCLARRNQRAPRAGTPGFRAPEVLLRHPNQTTAVDMWSTGVILLCLLSGKYPFFRAVDDSLSLAEIATILGTKVMKRNAAKLEKLFTCSEEKPTLDLMKICEILLKGSKNKNSFAPIEICGRCKQKSECVCLLTNGSSYISSTSDGNLSMEDKCFSSTISKLTQIYLQDTNTSTANVENQIYPSSVYDLLSRLLDPNPETRITADEALKHPFILPYIQ